MARCGVHLQAILLTPLPPRLMFQFPPRPVGAQHPQGECPSCPHILRRHYQKVPAKIQSESVPAHPTPFTCSYAHLQADIPSFLLGLFPIPQLLSP